MIDLRPHVLKWVAGSNIPAKDPVTGFIVPGPAGINKSVKCRWVSGGTKVFNNEDNSTVAQKGRISVDVGSEMPEVGQIVEVVGHFKGKVMEVYKGQLRWRIDV